MSIFEIDRHKAFMFNNTLKVDLSDLLHNVLTSVLLRFKIFGIIFFVDSSWNSYREVF